MRHVRTGDLLQPCSGTRCPGMVPLGSLLELCPQLRPYAWPMTSMPSEGFFEQLRVRRRQLGSHRMADGMARIYGPHHGEVFYQAGTGLPPTALQLSTALNFLEGFPSELTVVGTPGPQHVVANFVTQYRHRQDSTVLTPAPGHPGHLLVMLVHRDIEVLPGVPANPHVMLFPQRGLRHGDVLTQMPEPRFFHGEESEEEPEVSDPAGPPPPEPLSGGTSLACVSSHRAPRRQIIFDRPPADAQVKLEERRVQAPQLSADRLLRVATPQGRRGLPVKASCKLGEGANAQAAEAIQLQALLPPLPAKLESSLRFATNTDVRTHALAPFRIEQLAIEVAHIPLHTKAHQLVHSLEPLPPEQTGDKAMLFVDGSSDPKTGQGAWAIAVIVDYQACWYWGGFACDRIQGHLHDVHSAFEAELLAQLVAHLVIAASSWQQSCIIFDATAAASIATSQAHAQHWGALPKAAAAAHLYLLTQGRTPGLQHTKSHSGHPGNELADSLATWAQLNGASHTELSAHLTSLVTEGVLDWLWLPEASHSNPVWPQLSSVGTSATCPLPRAATPTVRPADWTMPQRERQQPARKIKLRLCTYNTLSAKSCLQRHSLQSFMRHHSLDVFFLQESREDTEAVRVVDGVRRFASPPDQGQLGCQIWVDVTKQPHAWDAKAFAVLHSHPRLLAVRAVYHGQPLLLVSGHARTSKTKEEDLQPWWHMLDALLRKVPRGHVPMMGLDANAHRAATTPHNANAYHMEALMAQQALCSSGTTSADGQPLCTWRSPHGQAFCIDYVLVPSLWQDHMKVLGTVPILDEHSGIDHEPLLVELEVQVAPGSRKTHTRLDVEKMHTEEGRKVIEGIFHSAPCPPWEVDVDSHLMMLNRHFQQQLMTHFRPQPSRPRNPVASSDTWALLLQKRLLRKQHRRRSIAWARECLHFCFRTWAAQRDATGPTTARFLHKLARAVINETLYGTRLKGLARRIRAAARTDEALYTRRVFAEASKEGPARKAHLIRAVLNKSGRRYKPPQVAIVLHEDGHDLTEPAQVLKRLGQHFARAEQATEVPMCQLADEPFPDQLPAWEDAQQLPTIADLARGFAGLKRRKAPGLSGLCGDFYQAAPALAAAHHYPLVLKMAARGTAPTLWTGSLSIPLAKPAKDRFSVTGYRAIALLESAAKAIGRALRPQLLEGLESIVHPGTSGARRGFPLEVPSLTGQAFLDYLKVNKQNGALLYVDGVSAFYSTNRAVLGQGTDEARAQWISSLPIEPDIKAVYIDIVRGRSCLEHAQISAMAKRLVSAGFRATWFTTLPEDEWIFRTTAGTIPGAPLADLLFQLAVAPVFNSLQACLERENLDARIGGACASTHLA